MARDFGFMPAEGPEYYFVSYNSEDADRIAPVAKHLAEAGIPLWYDRGLIHGEKWEEQITGKIAKAKAVMLFFTRGILHKEDSYVKKEYRIAVNLFGCKVYVVMMDQIGAADIPVTMAGWWMDIQERHNIEAAASPEGTAAAILQAIGSPVEKGPRPSTEGNDSLPQALSLFELLGIRNIGEFDIEKHWGGADPTVSIAAPIGRGRDGAPVLLDLHQRKDGPNGIIGGRPGAGKSEFLYTLLLSLALHYPPQHVKLHVVDPWGQSEFEVLQDLPHAGVSVNQFSDEAFDALLDYFRQETSRRDELLGHYGVQNIYQYLKKAKLCPDMPPMPHIIVTIDAYEELKRMWPEMAHQLLIMGKTEISRRYGFHMVFATNRPAGVIDDALYMCTQFKIFADTSSGQCMPGRMYLQTPVHDVPRQIQLAYSGDRAFAVLKMKNPELVEFFYHKSQLQTIVQAIGRFCLD